MLGFLSRMASPDLAHLDGVSAGRAHQLVAGALVARDAMRALGVSELEICPWAVAAHRPPAAPGRRHRPVTPPRHGAEHARRLAA
ncbi:hypothetical protein [Actinoplanes sp. NPDC023714]|uniref:Ppx/GppA phosphatase family protein n=1 Tax=Actinoplanes sp. NPDC023714 TaxID=3154322 RepID=UPI0033CCB2DC